MSQPSSSPPAKARYIMLGGFLGAGKTTAVAALAQHLSAQGLRIGLITNDQGSELVDTAMLRAKGFATEEIPGGCFCCRFNSLVDAAAKLTKASLPDVFIAEPVGSCTDLVATVTYPLRRMYGDSFAVAPLSVLVDPVRAEGVFGVAGGRKFSDKVLYIYRKQLEEADLIVITKSDTLDADRLACLRARLQQEYPHAEIFAVSVRADRGLAEWFARLTGDVQATRATMDVDYEMYAEGEALLGWLNATVQLTGEPGFDSDAVLKAFASDIQARLAGFEIAHLKMTLSPATGLGDIAVINLVRSDFVPELSLRLDEPVTSGQLIINLRAEADPEMLRDAVRAAVESLADSAPGVVGKLEHLEHFRPGKPEPTHRDVAAV
ncbi:MAG TPA: GTP-binding protein [Chthoniobacteraceae bacterium]|jgi:Ni2+-binding GTPase involved in maturation of urease and hydrogenase|nr:GTP-binding protein [Chthoniobacteraceae bacterium]